MNRIKKILKYFFLFSSGLCIGLFLTLMGASYSIVNSTLKTLSANETSFKNHNLKSIFELGVRYAKDLEILSNIKKISASEASAPLCENLCKLTMVSDERFRDGRVAYLLELLKKSKAEALKDPLFQIRVLELSILEKLYPSPLRKMVLEARERNNAESSFLSNVYFSLKLQMALVKSGLQVFFQKNEVKDDLKRVQTLRTLRKECQKGVSPRKVRQECENFATHQ